MARLAPIRRGSRTVPPSISGTPQRRQNTPNTAVSSATRRSHHSASSSPPATACPATAAITGFDSRSRVGPIGPSPSGSVRLRRSVATAVRSAPAQNVPPAPCRTATAAPSSASNARNASASAAAVGPSTALRRSGRSMVTVVTTPVALDVNAHGVPTPVAPLAPAVQPSAGPSFVAMSVRICT